MDETNQPFSHGQGREFSADPARYSEEVRLTTFLELHLPEQDAGRAYEQLITCAGEIDKIVNKIKTNATVAKYTYDGVFFESETEMVRLEDGTHFLQSLSNEVLTGALSAQGQQGILNAVNTALKDLDEVIVQLGSIEMTGKFENVIPKN